MAETPTSASGKKLKCSIVTPERAVVDEPADFVAVPMFDGELGILPGRQPLIGRLGIGEMRVTQGGTTKRIFIDGGFVQVRADVVTVLTPSALTAEDIKPDAVREKLAADEAKPARTEDELDDKAKDRARARAKLRVVRKGGAHTPHHA